MLSLSSVWRAFGDDGKVPTTDFFVVGIFIFKIKLL